jgi:mRNA interferase RelE/StbE
LAWTIEYTASATRQLRKFDKQTATRILDYMEKRVAHSSDPRGLGKALTGETFGAFWPYRVGDYRIVCDIQDTRLVVLVILIGNRRDVYR